MSSNTEKKFSFKIDNNHYEWDGQYITGADIKRIGNIPVDEEIYLVIKGHGDDQPVQDNTNVDLSNPGIEKFYSQKPKDHVYLLIVNGREKSWNEKTINYDQVVKLAFENYVPNETTIYTVTYTRGSGKKPEGSMVKGDVVSVKDKMVFNVTPTDRS